MKDLKIMLDGKEHTVKLLEERFCGKQKIYLLDFNVYKDIYKKEIKSIIKLFTKMLMSKYVFNDEIEYVNKICISDAHSCRETCFSVLLR